MFSRATKGGLDQKTARYRSLYKKIDEEDLERQRENLAMSIIPGLALFLYKLAAIGIIGGIIYFLSQWALALVHEWSHRRWRLTVL